MNQAVNWEAALEHVGGDVRLLRELLALFLEECPRWLAELERHLAASNAEGVQRTAHKFKGALLNFGAEAAGTSAASIETAGRARTLAGVDTMMASLRSELDRMLPDVREMAGTP
jgi:two-component system sensor histidine kinase/response regulator